MTAVPPRPAPGTPLVFRWRKWDGSPHWEHDCVYLGSDRWGDWVGQRSGWHSQRPGLEFDADGDNVTLIPPSGDYAATFNATHPRLAIYIDVAWDVRWEDGAPTGIDMDLDVVRARDGRGIWIDDRDEWDEHRVQYGYPLDVVTRLETVAIDLEREVTQESVPFDGLTAAHWLSELDRLG
ncbi:DUF402 domain-containing protein [Microbacterium flavum]|uniref:DUF402 domain-containing protein n=1 Tax=Microbacterium flavum TaxID=415216 RepID=A0ABS5XTT0_9MICO|nr:DUF402 domain-containing protein [Microbacterium flavum]MBT8796533.1 DUF402 domain-containing protein [Microbacterium flavum]